MQFFISKGCAIFLDKRNKVLGKKRKIKFIILGGKMQLLLRRKIQFIIMKDKNVAP